jgi:SAM-dependent methyltransferase
MLSCPQCLRTPAPTDGGYLCPSCQRLYPIIDGIPSFLIEGSDQDTFEPEFFGYLQKAEDRHFWFIGRREIILDTLKRHVSDLSGKRMLEIGCGNGNILRYLKERTELQLTGGDLFMEGLRFCRGQADIPLYQMNATSLPFHNYFDIIGMFDVLEHIEDDEQVLQECRKALNEKGRLVLTVPACPSLWGPFDELSHHQRRYSRRALREKLERAGFAIERSPHFMFFLFPFVYTVRFLKRRLSRTEVDSPDQIPADLRALPVINGLSLRLLRLERLLMRRADLPFGTSLLVLARKT